MISTWMSESGMKRRRLACRPSMSRSTVRSIETISSPPGPKMKMLV